MASDSEKLKQVGTILRTSLASSLSLAQEIVQFDSNETIADAFKKLISCEIRSAPVIDKEKNTIIGLIDFIDLLHFLIHFLESHKDLDIASKSKLFFHHTIKDLPNYSKRNPFNPVLPTTSIYDAMQNLGTGCRRVLIVDNGQISNIITQSSVVNLLRKHQELFDPLFKLPIAEKNLGIHKITSCTTQETALGAFTAMCKGSVSSIPLLNTDHKIFAILAARDLKLLFHELSLENLNLSVEDYVAKVRCLNTKVESFPYFAVPRDTSVSVALAKLAATKAQRVYILDDNHHVVGVIALRDMIQLVIESV